ncbi:MAG: hypothetical protein MUP21_06080 [Dehalococcoidia bacterium]|nr:hypothetical protein [Dehalococcoidia bacterium]
MKRSLLAELLPDGREMVKEAFIGAAARLGLGALSRVGKVLVKNPLKSATAAFAANDVASSASRMGDVGAGSRNLMRSVATPPANM